MDGSQSSLMNSPFPLDIRLEKTIDGFFDIHNLKDADGISLLTKTKTILAVINADHILERWEGVVDYVIEGAAPNIGENMLLFWEKFDDIQIVYRQFKARCASTEANEECIAEITIPVGISFYHFYFRGSRAGVTVLRIIELSQYGREHSAFVKEKTDLEDFKNSIVSAISHNHITPLSVLDASHDEISREMNQFRVAVTVLEETIESFLQSHIQTATGEGMEQLQEVFKARTALQEINKRVDKFDRKFRLHLRTIASQTSELRQKTLNMLAYSDICANKFKIRMRDRLNLIDLCHEAHDVFSAHAMSKGVEFETSMNPNHYSPYVMIDAEKFRQALFAPLQNAYQFSHTNGQPIQFHFDINDRQSICFKIRDYGCGIADSHLKRICEPFFVHHPMHDRSDVEQSLGLGLFLARTFIEAMDGKLIIESEEGVQTTVKIILPLTMIATHRLELRSHKIDDKTTTKILDKDRRRSAFTFRNTLKSDVSSDAGGPMYDTVLISEDNKITGRILRQFIKKLGYKVELYETGIKALDQVKTNPSRFFAACLDYNIPNDVPLTGADIAVKMQDVAPRLQVVIITANLNSDVRQEVESKGITEFMSKPFQKERLTDFLRIAYQRIHDAY